jgi:hypothetical protein
MTSEIRTLDDLFQYLITERGFELEDAHEQITAQLRRGKLKVALHIAAGARKHRPRRQATDEEIAQVASKIARLPKTTPREREEIARIHEESYAFLYDVAPPDGISEIVNWQSWGRIFCLAVREGKLIVELLDGLDYPWNAYAFTIANPEVKDTLWPPQSSSPASSSPPPTSPPPDAAPEGSTPRPWERLPPGTSKSKLLEIVYAHMLDTAPTAAERDVLRAIWWKNLLREAKDLVGYEIVLKRTTVFKVRKRVLEARREQARARLTED